MRPDRDRLLLEMGLGPLWKARSMPLSVAAPPASTPPINTPPVSAVAEVASPGAMKPAIARSQALAAPMVDARRGSDDDDARNAAIAQMEWPALKALVAGCTACNLCKGRTNTVFGVGDESAGWMIIGEAPGAEEDARGEPFVGQAGQLLDAMLGALDMHRRQNVYIANLLKCRPPGNRNPAPEEVARCAPHLLRQVALVKPGLILSMGRFASQALLGTEASIASLRGRLHSFAGTPVVVTYHPAYLLRTPTDKARAWEDLLFARATWLGLQSMAAAAT